MLNDVLTDPFLIAFYAIGAALPYILIALGIAAVAAGLIIFLAVRSKKRKKKK